MQIARVIGTVVSTVKNKSLDGRKMLIVQTLDADLKAKGSPMVAPSNSRMRKLGASSPVGFQLASGMIGNSAIVTTMSAMCSSA